MQKNKQILLLFIIFLYTFIPSVANAKDARITVDHLNVRSGPGTDYETIGKVYSDETYDILQEKNEWVEIQLEDQTGWITSKYIDIRDIDIIDEGSSNSSLTIPEDHTQIRTGPSTKEKIKYFASKNETYEVVSENGDWYEIENDQNNGYIHKQLVAQNPSPKERESIKEQVFVIDPGHGGYDAGAISISKMYEKEFTLKTAMELEKTLSLLGAEVYLTRTNDEYIRLGSRVSLANLKSPSTFISIHYNSFPESPNASGVVSYYYDENDKQLAENIQKQITRITGARDREVSFGNYQVIRHNINQAILLELGFLSNEKEEKLLQNNQYQQMLVRGIVNGILANSKDK